jgi:hypothetical protein
MQERRQQMQMAEQAVYAEQHNARGAGYKPSIYIGPPTDDPYSNRDRWGGRQYRG